MSNQFKTEQETFWAGSFGDEYADRNRGLEAMAANLAYFSQILNRTQRIESIIEFGANIGLNMEALRELRPVAELSAIEINQKAIIELKKIKELKVYPQSILEFNADYQRDLVFTKGVLIHIDPNSLANVYDLMYQTSRRYICIGEYYNPTPVEVRYRGNQDKLFKRDFAGEMIDRFSDLRLIDYGFYYHRDTNFPQDDITWFLLEKSVK